MATSTIRRVIKGDTIARDITSSDVPVFDDDWSGTWAIATTIGQTPITSGDLGKSGDKKTFQLRVPPEKSALLPEGNCYLLAQVTNATIVFRLEVIREQIQVLPQGIP